MTTNARPAPVWDEEAVVKAIHRRAAPIIARYTSAPMAPLSVEVAIAAVAVVREHLPVKPDREAIERALLSASGDWDMSPLDRSRMVAAQTHAMLALWPGRSEAEVKAEALRDAADAVTEIDGRADDHAARWLRDRADRLAVEGGGDRG